MTAAICGVLLLAVFLAFGRTVWHDFVNYDDDAYVYENAHVADGLTGSGIAWAFTNGDVPVWIPATWLSLMSDAQLHGQNAWGFHLTNVLLHAAASVGLFLVLRNMTGRDWPSALAAALFALHPLRVESVAWITERKDVLSGLFFVLTLAAYLGYVRRPFSPARYSLVVVCFAAGLMSKPMLATLPFVLLLLDYWPLGRILASARKGTEEDVGRSPSTFQAPFRQPPPSPSTLGKLIVEKIPLFALAAVVCTITYLVQGKALAHNGEYPFLWRLENALISYITYLERFFWPANLSVSYPRLPIDLPQWKVWISLLILLGVTAAAIACRRRRPYFPIGWLWYLGMLVPVIGLLQVGTVSEADRFMYLPQIGLGIALAWGAADLCGTSPTRRWALSGAAVLSLLCLARCASLQASYWRNSETLWTHALKCNPCDAFAHGSLGMALQRAGHGDEAIAEYRAAIRIRPDDDAVHNNLGGILAARGKLDEAMIHFRKAVDITPDYVEARSNLGHVLADFGRLDEAVFQFRKALQYDPGNAEARRRLDDALHRRIAIGADRN
jgi:protein O-mannosyl-transferase